MLLSLNLMLSEWLSERVSEMREEKIKINHVLILMVMICSI